MEPFYFGDDSKRLLGLYHPPRGSGNGDAVLICPPILGDYMRSHGLLRQLAIQLSEAGFHVLRFDYGSTGDSQGDIRDASVASWIEDIRSAARELTDISGTRNISAIGLRFGATLAVNAQEEFGKFKRLLLIDPIVSGAEYVDTLREIYSLLLDSHEHLTSDDEQATEKSMTGYDIGTTLAEEVANLRITDRLSSNSGSVSILFTDEAPLAAGVCAGLSDDRSVFPHECNWTTFSETVIFGADLVPAIVSRVVR